MDCVSDTEERIIHLKTIIYYMTIYKLILSQKDIRNIDFQDQLAKLNL